MAKKRIEFKLNQERRLTEEKLRKEEESIKRQEAMKQATLEYQHKLKVIILVVILDGTRQRKNYE